ncbi:MAG: thioredoxin domain-containing protein [Chitinophagaceae bacterium]
MKASIGTSLVLAFSLSCQSQSSTFQLEPDAFEKGIKGNGIQLLDVRTAGEYNSAHLKNALQADWTRQDEFKDRIQHLDKEKSVYVYCLSGGRSAAAAKWMRQEGFRQVYELTSGITGWRNAGKPIEQKALIPQMTLESYQQQIKSHPVVLVDFGAVWCPPCKKMEPILDQVLKELGDRVKLVKIDGGNDTEVMRSENVESLPVFIIYKNGQPVWRHRGITTREELLKNL